MANTIDLSINIDPDGGNVIEVKWNDGRNVKVIDESQRDIEEELFHRQLWRNLQQMKKNEAKIKALENET